MFTGLVREKGRVAAVKRSSGGTVLTVTAPVTAPGSGRGASVSVDGACLTVVRREGERLSFDVSGETLSRTTLGGLRPGDEVNLEEALTAVSKLGGHYVQGHVDGVGKVVTRLRKGNSILLTIRVPGGLERYLVSKGSIAVDGVSLTINEIRGVNFSVNIIPETLKATTLESRKAGERVNIETDILAKYVEKLTRENREERKTGGSRFV